MSKWKIDPAGVQSTIELVALDQKELNKELTEAKFTAIFDGLKWGAPITAVVGNSLNLVLQDQATNLNNIAYRVNAGMAGVANATIAYNKGQEEMIGNFQSEMSKSAESGDFKYFDENGYKE